MSQPSDIHAESRKTDHIALAFKSQLKGIEKDNRFNYEPLFSKHPSLENQESYTFLGKKIGFPLWISSMTGGTEKAFTINQNLAIAANKYQLGFALGSCRSILESNERLKDFNWRKTLGVNLPFYANIGIAQLEKLVLNNKLHLIDNLINKLSADGIIIHINPMQEAFQPEGDRFTMAPIETLQRFSDAFKGNIIVKEVGQGMGPKSLEKLLELPIKAIELAAFGGTNFAMLELLRSNPMQREIYKDMAYTGHTAEEMVGFINQLIEKDKCKNKEFILSGGVKSFLDGYYLINKLQAPSVYGQASGLLKYAESSFEELDEYLSYQMEGFRLANAFLTINK